MGEREKKRILKVLGKIVIDQGKLWKSVNSIAAQQTFGWRTVATEKNLPE